MGVLRCDRNGCENIMCNRYSHKYGYICYECFKELTEKYTGHSIKEFMESEKDENSFDDYKKKAFIEYCEVEFEYN